MKDVIEVELRVRPVIDLSGWIAARACACSDHDGDVLAWYLDVALRGGPVDTGRSPRSNMLSYNVMQVRDLPCSRR